MKSVWSVSGIALFGFLLWGLVGDPLSASSSQGNQGTPAAQSTGSDDSAKGIFEASCSGCHGLDASGGQGPNIQRAPATLGDDEVARIIKTGVPGTGMPAFAGLSNAQGMQVAAYIRSLASAAIAGKTKVAGGDAEKGKVVYGGSGCANCHTIGGRGGSLGPDLTQIGSMRAPDYLLAALLNPGANLPESAATGVSTGKWTEYLMFRAVTKDGQNVEGMRVAESSFAIVLEDSKGDYHSFQKPELKTLQKEFGKSFMPAVTLSIADLDNLTAYLSGLKSAQ